MRAIDILFEKVDELNAKIKYSDDIDEKYQYAELIGDVVNAIKDLGRYRHSQISYDQERYL